MSKMKAKFRKGSNRKRLIVVTALLAVLLIVAGALSALAASSWYTFEPTVVGAQPDKQGRPGKDGAISASLEETINFQSNEVFVAGNNSLSGIYYLVIETNDMGQARPLILEKTDSSPRYWTEDTSKTTSYSVRYIYSSQNAITAGTFNSIMSQLSVKFHSTKDKTGTGKVSISGYSLLSPPTRSTSKPVDTYTCEFTFIDYAEGSVDEESLDMDYKSDYAASYTSRYDDDVPEGTAKTGLLVESPDAGNGKAEFDLYLDKIGGAYQVSVGYQVKKSTEAWNTSIPKVYVQKNVDVGSLNTQKPFHLTVEGLDSDTTYTIRGIVATDGKEGAPKYTDAVTFQYKKPNINSFNIGGVTQVYQGGKGFMNLSMLATFNDVNAVGKGTYGDVNERTFTGPALRADVYFTDYCDFQPNDDDEFEDRSKWYKTSLTASKEMTNEEGEIATSFTQNWLNFTIPKALSDVNPAASTEEINSRKCAFKLVVTDLYTGYTTVSYSDTFTIDSSKPDKPQVYAMINGVRKDLTFENAVTVGGSSEAGGNQVAVNIGGSDDHGGSGVKNYSYSMYSLATGDVPEGLTTTREVLEELAKYDEANHGKAEYTDWKVLPAAVDAEGNTIENMSQLIIARDGYYRVIARAQDEAGFDSDVVEAYFRVDLTAPSTPVVRLAKKESNGTFTAYDNRTYTDVDVWAFAYSKPLTAKELATFKYSTNGGLTWEDISSVANEKKLVKLTNTTDKVSTFVDDACITKEDFVYQVGIDLTGLGLSDYVSVLFKAVDTLGNESLVSSEVHMRTSSKVTAVATMTHDPIEVAMALGNTNLTLEQNIVPLKNRAAKMINEKYYGTGGSTTIGDANFNPYEYTKGHDCSYATDSGTGACKDGTSCKYEQVEAAGYTIYKPEWINISGLAAGTEMSIKDWVPYYHNSDDHDGIKKEADGTTVTPNHKTNITAEPSADKGYIVEEDMRGGDKTLYACEMGFDGAYYSYGDGKVGKGRVIRRRATVIDVSGKTITDSRPSTDSNRDTVTSLTYDGRQGDWSHILFTGYGYNANLDWLFYPFSQNTNKSIIFTMDTSKGYFHTYTQSGFWFNTTIRQNSKGEWVVSGYRLMIVSSVDPELKAKDTAKWYLNDVQGQHIACEIQIQKFTDEPLKGTDGMMVGGRNPGEIIARVNPSETKDGAAIQNFMIDLTGSTVKVYQLEGERTAEQRTVQYFRNYGTNLFAGVKYTDYVNLDSQKNPTQSTAASSGDNKGAINIARPSVEGHQIGVSERKNWYDTETNPYMDTNCYGFGPVCGFTYYSHECAQETRITFSNVRVSYNIGRTLSEVVNEPSWGDGKSRFILNMSDDAQSDFKEPALTSQIQWRLNNDKARYIGWGIDLNEHETLEFLNRMAGLQGTYEDEDLAPLVASYGMYEKRGSNKGEAGSSTEITDLATYITQQYFMDLGYDTSKGIVKNQVSPTGGVPRGISITADNIGNMNFTVDPPERAESSANPDFPSGRWYMIHDPTGMGDKVDDRSGKPSDALDTNVSLPGRYTYYFAPSAEAIATGLYDPDEAIFDFVVNQKPVARFNATIQGSGANKYLQIDDLSYDPDCADVVGTNGTAPKDPVSGTQLSGVVKREYKYQYLYKNGANLVVGKEIGWVDSSNGTAPAGKTINALTGRTDGTLPDNGVLTIYQRVTDTVTNRVAVRDANNRVTGYKYQTLAGAGALSDVCQVNATEGVSITYAPQSTVSMDPVIMYDTASAAGSAHRTVTVTRSTTQSQGKKFAFEWYINVGDNNADADENGYVLMGKSGNNYTYKGTTVLTCTKAPVSTGETHTDTLRNDDGTNKVDTKGNTISKTLTTSTGGEWTMDYNFIKSVDVGNYVKLQLREYTWGVSAAASAKQGAGAKDTFISDQSARAVLYTEDKFAPTAQIVETGTRYVGQDDIQPYAASTYLDVTNNDRFVHISVSGSEDKEGVLAGYGYYFYDKDNAGNETAWYKMNTSTGKLESVGSRNAALVKIAASKSTDEAVIEIGKAHMRKEPTDSLNVAIFAYDNQDKDSYTNETKANQTQKTRITDIKLSVSKPMPPEISVTNSSNKNVAYIGNLNGFNPSYKGYVSTPDTAKSDLLFFSGTAVNVQFTPKKERYVNQNGTLIESTAGAEYYQDYYGAADLTGVANIQYTVRYKYRENQEWWTKDQLISEGIGEMPVNQVIPSAQQLTFTEDGVYELTAAVVNGSGTVSETRTVKFTIDKTPPANMQVRFTNSDGSEYTSNVWTRSVKIEASAATDTNADTAVYQYSQDGGKTWVDMGSLTQPSASVTMDKSGKYNVQVRAIDRAGNELLWNVPMTVCIDTTPPDTKGPALTATYTMQDMYDAYVVSLRFDENGGTVYSNCEGEEDWNKLDREVAVETGKSVRFEIRAKEGHVIGKVTYNGSDVTAQLQEVDDTLAYLEIRSVTADSTLAVTFPETDLSAAAYRVVNQGTFAMNYATAFTAAMFNSNDSTNPVATIAALDDDGDDIVDPNTDPDPDDEDEDEEDPEPEPDPDPDPVDKPVYTVQAYNAVDETGNHGSVSVDKPEVTAGTTVLVTARANSGYRVSKLVINNDTEVLYGDEELERSGRIYTYRFEPTEDTIIFVYYEKVRTRSMQVNWNIECGDVVVWEVVQSGDLQNLGGGAYIVPEDGDVIIQMNAEDGYGVKSLKIDGEEVEDFNSLDGYYSYHVEPYEDDGPDPGILVEVEFDVSTSVKRVFNVSVGLSSDGKTHGTITASGAVNIPAKGSRVFTIVPELGYRISKLNRGVYEDGELDVTDVVGSSDLVQIGDGADRKYLYTLKDPGTSGTLEVIFEQQTYTLNTGNSVGGGVNVTPLQGGLLYLDAVPEGSGVLIEPVAKNGYRIDTVFITEYYGDSSKTYEIGAVKSFTIENIHTNITIDARFVQRVVDHVETSHMITAVANNVKDADDALHDQPYRFCISDAPIGTAGAHTSPWSEWSASNTISYTGIQEQGSFDAIPLDPNRQYYVYVMTRDRVGNISDPVVSTVYTMANMPGIDGVEALDDGGKYTSLKSVALTVAPGLNPDDTEYLVYASNSNAMTDMFIANETEANGGWSKLGVGNTFVINGLTPGRWYYFQVVARNKDGYSSQISKDIVGIMLSPAAPPENSFYFEEQKSPVAPVVLRWVQPEGEIKSIQIYRDGMFLKEVEVDTLTYADDKVNFPGDAIVQYSYAYVNSAGVGSSRVAVSQEYYDANSEAKFDQDKRDRMDRLVDAADYDLFSETMTYPVFPYGCKEPVSASTPGGTDNSGTITVQMKYDANESGRYQKYFLTLKAFKMITDADGEPIPGPDGQPQYNEVGIDEWDPLKKNRAEDGVTQLAKETQVTMVSGETAARATWTDLSTLYEYNIYVEEIRSTGAGLGGQTSAGIEYSLGKTYVVNRENFYYLYTKDEGTPELIVGGGTWTDDDRAEYTRYAKDEWDTPINTKYITFNKSPSIDLADPEYRYYDNDAEKIRTGADGKSQYLLVEQTMEDKTFHVNVAAWDPDGSREDSMIRPAVKGTIASIPGAAPEIPAGTEMPKTEEAARKPENLYPITFDASSLSTGIYTQMEMKASDSDTETTKVTGDVLLVINRNTPNSSVVGGTTKLLENNVEYNKEALVQTNATAAKDSAASTNLSKVALLVMPKQYEDLFGAGGSDYNTLYNWLVNGTNASALAEAKKLLGNYASNSQYVNQTTGYLTVDGMNLAIVRVAPPVTRYITVTEAQYNAVVNTANSDKVFVDKGTQTTYWMEFEYALKNNYCSWLTVVNDTTVKPSVTLKLDDKEQPIDKENTYMMKLVANFGGNTSSQTVGFVIRTAPSTEILSSKSFKWQDTAEAEYKYYMEEGLTIKKIVDMYEGCYDPANTPMEEPANSTANAYKTEIVNGKTVYYVYKLVDAMGNVGNDFISGEVRTKLGVHPQFAEVGVLLVTQSDYNPNSGDPLPDGHIESPVYKNYNNEPVTESGDLRFSVSGLERGTIYYLWSYYKLPGDDAVRVYNKSYVALTTEASFSMAQYGFSRELYSYKEQDFFEPRDLGFNVSKLGSTMASATVRITAVYYAADEYGNLLKDEQGELIPLTGDQLAAAKKTIRLNDLDGQDLDGNDYRLITFGGMISLDVYMRLADNYDEQGHMIVRLMLTIENSDEGYCYVTNGGGYTDIFVQDDESPVTSYILGVINDDGTGKEFLTELIDNTTKKLDHYEYQFNGLQVDYTQLSTVILSYENRGTGDLEDITVEVWRDRNDSRPSEYFEAERPSETNLRQALGGIGTVEVHPVPGLADGVYEGWIVLTAEHVEEPVKIKIRQVVGQSTLRGRIYITPEMPSYNARTGKAKIYLYDADTAIWDSSTQTYTSKPDYVGESNEYGGEFVIYNILNKGAYSQGRYHVIIERDGFLTFNSRKYRPGTGTYWLELGETSKTYTYNLRLLGGDIGGAKDSDGNIVGDQIINDTDMNLLVEYFNRTTDEDPEKEAIIRRCDFNQDGMVNALDRMFLTGNLGCTDRSYPYGDTKEQFTLKPDD